MKEPKRLLGLSLAAWVIGAVLASTCAAAVILTDSPDIKIRDATNPSIEALGYETSVAVHPDDWRIVLMGLIAYPSTKSTGWFSTDGGVQWHGDNEPADPNFSGDPTVAILKGAGLPTRYLIQSITQSTEQWVTWTDTPSVPWTGDARVCNELDSTDKGFICADNHPSSACFGQLFSLWSDPWAGGGGLYFRYSSDADTARGAYWDPQPLPIALRIGGSTWGGVIGVGIGGSALGHVYTAWPAASTLQSTPVKIVNPRPSPSGQARARRPRVSGAEAAGRLEVQAMRSCGSVTVPGWRMARRAASST